MDKKQGRRSAEDALKTKAEILEVAGQLFSQYGYKKVSLRQISEIAGVSHSLLRYHFGSKEKVWQQISDDIYHHFQNYFQYLLGTLPHQLPPNVKLYMMMNRVLAYSLNDPRAIKFLADAVQQEKEMVNYFLEPNRKDSEILNALMEEFKQQQPTATVTLGELRWQAAMFSHGASTLEPLMLHAFENESRDSALFRHWQTFSQMIAVQLLVEKEYIETPQSLTEMIVPPQNCFS
ncbi:MAG: TetR/AcrR family transcriptional regulator [Vibrio sp.]